MGKIWRTVGLWVLIVFTVLLLVACFFWGCYPWNWVFAGIAGWIVGWELWGSIFGFKQPDGTVKRHTISQMFWKYAVANPKKAIVIVSLFAIAMAGLVIHLLA
jgi:hypothetical protein